MSAPFKMSLADAHQVCAQCIRDSLLVRSLPESSRAALQKSLAIHERETKR